MSQVEIHYAADGLSELDNPLPRWWLYLFILCIIFAIGYSFYYPATWFWEGSSGWTSEKQWTASMPANTTAGTDVDLVALGQQPGVLDAGKAVFTKTCSACHGPDGKGKIGPNLTDAEWKYGGTDKDILKSIRKGRPAGMPAWGKALKPDEVKNVAAYVRSIGVH